MPGRKTTPKDIETNVLRRSNRRCALCFHLDYDSDEKEGQIAHLDEDPSNYAEDNLAFLCLRHHTLYDSKTSQHKNYTITEVKAWRDDLYKKIEEMRAKNLASSGNSSTNDTTRLHRQRDLEMLTSLLQTIHWPTLDEHVEGLPYVVVDPIFHFWEGFNAFFQSSLFHLYDSQLRSEVSALHSSWNETVSYGHHYRKILNGNYVFDNPDHRPFSREQDRDWQAIEQAARRLRTAKQNLLDHIRREYAEIDLAKLSGKAWKEFGEYRTQLVK